MSTMSQQMIVTWKIDSVQLTSGGKAELPIYVSSCLGTQRSVLRPYQAVSILCGLIL